jgi:ubiquinone biosynthesis monooxygenase Coq7
VPLALAGLPCRAVGNASARTGALRHFSRGDAAAEIPAVPRHAVLELWWLDARVFHRLPRQKGHLGLHRRRRAAVHRHLDDQLHFLQRRDAELHRIILSIREEELAHLHHAETQLGSGAVLPGLRQIIALATDALIWLSTWGDSSRMAYALRVDRG